MTTVPRCSFCRAECDPRFMWQRIQGWERKAQGGSRRGGSDIALRERREEFACGHCIDQIRNGRSPKQGALL